MLRRSAAAASRRPFALAKCLRRKGSGAGRGDDGRGETSPAPPPAPPSSPEAPEATSSVMVAQEAALTAEAEAGLVIAKQLAQREKNEAALREKYDPKYVYSSTNADGTSEIAYKHNPPENPVAHQEGAVLDFSDSVAHPMRHNPFSKLAAEAKSGNWQDVSGVSIGIPGSRQRSLYGFERRNKHEVTNYGRENDYISATPPELDESVQLHLALARLPAFDATRESLFDKYALRDYNMQRDLRLIEREALLHERGLAEYHSELQLQEARAARKITIHDAVMQNPYKWLPLKQMESEDAYARQGEDVHYSKLMLLQAGAIAGTILCTVVYLHLFLEDGTLTKTHMEAAGEVSGISGFVGRSELFGSYKEVGEMYRFQDAVTRHTLKLNGGDHESLRTIRRYESSIREF
ncbi:hypothetical protein DIPPA_14107 [Diplonema papillatum]|nr:hypothetical protein DIPPA_14107 [Diplonema papillatum]